MPAPLPPVILASGSPRRRDLLRACGLPAFTVIRTDIDERQHDGEPPIVYAMRLSGEKAAAARHRSGLPVPGLIIAADTIVFLPGDEDRLREGDRTVPGTVLGKPADAAEARSMLHQLRGRDHIVCTALAVALVDDAAASRTVVTPTLTRVTMRAYTDAEIDAYIATGDPFDKAGAYAIQHQGFHPVAAITGSRTNVIGLPVETLRRVLADQYALDLPPFTDEADLS